MSKLEKAANGVKHWGTIYGVMFTLISGLAVAANEYHGKFLQVDDFKQFMAEQKISNDKADVKKEIKILIKEIADLKISLRYARKTQDKNRIKDLITSKEADIKILKEGE